MTLARSVVTAVVAILVLQVPMIAAASSDGRLVAMPTREHTKSRPTGGSANLFSHGGAVETAPAIYVSYWGPEWATGWGASGTSSADAQNYVNGFLGNVGGSSWINSTSQYCQGVAYATVTCPSTAQFIANPSGQVRGTWNDPTPVPSQPSQSAIAAAAARLASQFGYSANATYFVFTPTQKSMRGFGTRWCAWHSSQTVSSGPLAYAYIPYQPDAGASCGMGFVNSPGYFDGFSIVGGHEYAEAQTDPFPNSGWLDGSGAENGDKCAWISSGQGAATNITLGGAQYAVQSLWSNAFNGGAGGCVSTY